MQRVLELEGQIKMELYYKIYIYLIKSFKKIKLLLPGYQIEVLLYFHILKYLGLYGNALIIHLHSSF